MRSEQRVALDLLRAAGAGAFVSVGGDVIAFEHGRWRRVTLDQALAIASQSLDTATYAPAQPRGAQ